MAESPNLFNLLLIHLLPGVGKRRILELLARAPFLLTEDPGRNFWLYLSREAGVPLPPHQTDVLTRHADGILARQEKGEFRLLYLHGEGYPPLLREIYDPPLLLFVKGDPELLSRDCLAMVGARHATDYGVAVAEAFASRLAASGLVIVSGLAKGIDAASHVGALRGGGRTAAVLGSGVDIAYPRETRDLHRRIAREGCIVSEFPPGTPPAPQNFPIRNRVISGLCRGVVIVEATQRSGSLITARLSLEHGRELFAVPGPVHSPASVGPNYLIKQGAKLVQVWQDIVEELPETVRARLHWEPCSTLEALTGAVPLEAPKTNESLTSEEESVYNRLSFDRKTHVEDLMGETGLSPGALGTALLSLQFRGLAEELPGQFFIRTVR